NRESGAISLGAEHFGTVGDDGAGAFHPVQQALVIEARMQAGITMDDAAAVVIVGAELAVLLRLRHHVALMAELAAQHLEPAGFLLVLARPVCAGEAAAAGEVAGDLLRLHQLLDIVDAGAALAPEVECPSLAEDRLGGGITQLVGHRAAPPAVPGAGAVPGLFRFA